MKFQTPLPLNPGDKVAIISPSSGIPFLFPWVYKQGLNRIRETFKLVPVEFPTACQSPEYLSQNPEVVQKTLTQLFQILLLKASLRQLAELTKSEYFLTWTKSLSQKIPKFLWVTAIALTSICSY